MPRVARTLRDILEGYERIVLIQAISAAGGSRTRAAQSLGIRRGLLYARIKHLKIDTTVMPSRQGRPPKEER